MKNETKRANMGIFVRDMLWAQLMMSLLGILLADIKEEDRQQWWLEAQKKAELIADEVRKKQNHAYFVPKTFVAHGKVREQYASGQRWRDVFKTLSPQDKEWACKALAQFVNDMSELRPIKHDNRVRSVPGVPIKGPGALADILGTWDEKYVAPEDKKLIQDVYEYLINNKKVMYSTDMAILYGFDTEYAYDASRQRKAYRRTKNNPIKRAKVLAPLKAGKFH